MRQLFYLTLIYPLLVILTVLALFFALTPSSILSGVLNEEILSAIRLSLTSAVWATFLGILIGMPIAYRLARRNFYGKSVIETLIDLPISIPPLVCGVGLLLLFGAKGWIGKNLLDWGIQVVFTLKGAILAQFFIATPLLIQTAKSSFASIDNSFEKVARTLGATPGKAFLKVTLPLSWVGIVTGITMTFARCLAEFGATLMLASAVAYKTETLPLAVFMNMSTGDFELAVAAAVILITISFTSLFIIRITGRFLYRGYVSRITI
jgi:molybdate transport system permease protein